MTFGYVVKGKGFTEENVVTKALAFIDSLGYPDVRLKADNENAVMAVLKQIKVVRDGKRIGSIFVDPAIEDQPQTNGAAEMAVQELTEQARKYKIALETRFGKPIMARSVVFKWLIEHAADTF